MGRGAALVFLLVLGVSLAEQHQKYLGTPLGALSELHHGVKGKVFAVDSRTLYLQDFHYDGEGPAAYFYVGSSGRPQAAGALRLRDERGGTGPLRRYRGEGVTLALPEGKTLKDVRWFAVWCDEYSVNFGDVSIPRDLEYPKPVRVGALKGVHGVSSDPIVVVDAQTLLVPNFSYDGEAPDAKFWVGRGEKPSPAGIRIPDENGKEAPLRKYDKKTIVLTLPGELTVFDIGHFGVWCEAFTVDFGHVALPKAQLQNVPPSLKMLGVSPQSKLNCEVLYEELAFEVRWAVAGESIVLQLVAKLDDGEYMSFGVSGDPSHSQMVGGDVAVAWVDKGTLKGYAHDYYLDAKSQCAGVRGSCPDERLGAKTDSIRLLNAALVNGYSIVTYQRSLKAADQLDRPVLTNGSQPIIWAIGPLNSRQEVSYHQHFTKGDRLIEFGRPPFWNCPMPEGDDEPKTTTPPATRPPTTTETVMEATEEQPQEEQVQKSVLKPNAVPTPKPAAKVEPWEIPPIQCYEPPDGVFYAQMGPTGGKHGYPAITGHVGWGISWYINGLLIPEITVVRGRKYTFVAEGGSDPEVPARYHPFYITNDPVGGYYHKTDEEKKGIEIYAGVRRTRSGELIPTGVGRLCNWTPDSDGPGADEFPSFGAYQRTLTLVCEEGSPGVVTWTPDARTPDTVYYQCFTHRHLGWKIHVVDACEEEGGDTGAESRMTESLALPADLAPEESIQVHTRLRPDSNFLDQRRKVEKIINTKTNYNDFSSDKDRHEDVLSGEEPVVSRGQIRDVITAVESIETRMREHARNHTHRKPPPPPQPPQPPQPLQPVPTHQYQVHEDPEAVPERPFREEDEYVVAPGKPQNNYFLPASAHPLTLQSVLRPTGSNKRPPFRRPAPPEIKLRRPPAPPSMPPPPYGPAHGKPQFPLPMPSHHGPHQHHPMKNLYGKPNFNRPPMGPQMRPPQGPVPPMKAMPPLPHSKPTYGPPKTVFKQPVPQIQPPVPQHMVPQQLVPVPTIVMGKPGPGKMSPPSQTQTLSLGRTDIIGNQIVKSQITLPGGGDSLPSSNIQHSHIHLPGQIILGKPMDHPVPLDQQMTPSHHHIVSVPSTSAPESKRNTQRYQVQEEQFAAPEQSNKSQQSDVKFADFMGESTDLSTLKPAVNTGFKPNTIVIESGFKPIIREPLMDRMDNDVHNSNRRQDIDVEEDEEESPQPISNHVYQIPSEKLTQSFEPMFIPSPVDLALPPSDVRLPVNDNTSPNDLGLPTNDRLSPLDMGLPISDLGLSSSEHSSSVDLGLPTNDRTKEVFPSNHAREDRPHPVFIQPDRDFNALFGKTNMEKEAPADMVMEADRVSPQYLPPDPKLPKEYSQKITKAEQTFTTYDGKIVSAATLTSVPDEKPNNKPFSAKLPSTTELLLKTPQFGPFKGDIPPDVAGFIKNAPEISIPESTGTKISTKKSVNSKTDTDFFTAEASDWQDVKVEPETSTKVPADGEYQYYESYDDDDEEPKDRKTGSDSESHERKKRDIKNQIDFQTETKNIAPRVNWSSLLLLPLLLELF